MTTSHAARSCRTMLAVITAVFLMGICLAPAVFAADTVNLTVKMVTGLSTAEQAAVITHNGGVEKSAIAPLRIHVVTVPTTSLPLILQDYKNDPKVESVEVIKSRKAEALANDQHVGVQWALPKIGWDQIYGKVVTKGTARVALLDTGIDATHPDLKANVIAGTSILDGSNGLKDLSGHGTQMAGIVAAVTGNSKGIAGVAYRGIKLMPVTVLDATGTGQDSDIIQGIVWAADNGANVILMAFSNPDFSQHLQDAIDYAWAKGIVLVAATGNSGVSTPTFPAGDHGVIGISATDESDTLVATSNYGEDTFLAAPGTNIYTTTLGGSYTYISGTSTSSAVVAGVAAFMKAVDPSLANGVILTRLALGAAPVGVDDPDKLQKYGYGRVNMANAIANTSTASLEPIGAPRAEAAGIGPYKAAAATTDTFTTAGTNTWTAPTGVTSITVEVWGGGGRGGANVSSTSARGGGGGGGGAYTKVTNYTVTPGNGYTAWVGAGSSTIAAGADSYFGNATTIMAKGGSSVADNTTGGATGGLSSAGVPATGSTRYSGGTGGNGSTTNYSGGGGSSAGTASNGNTGNGVTAGAAPTGGGAGGDGASVATNVGSAGSQPGGGSGGAFRTSAGSNTPRNGGVGKVVITYTLPAIRLAITSVNGGSNPTAGTGFSVTVQAQDTNSTVTNVVASTAVSLTLNTGIGTLGGTLTGTITAGTNSVTISGVTYTKAESGVSLTATRTGGDVLDPVTSTSFVVNAGIANKLAFTTQPGGGIAGTAWTTQPVVTVQDSNSNTVTGSTASITLSIGTNPGSGALTCTTNPRTAASGVSTFAGCSINNSGTGYTLTAASSGLYVATSSSFNITPTHTVTFDANGGTGTMSPQVSGTTANLTTNTFTRTGYTFSGWNIVAVGGGTSYANGASYGFAADMTLYAQWTINTYTVTFNVNGGTGTMTAQTGNYNTTAALTTNTFTRTGYTFAGWNTVAGGSGASYANGANYTFTANVTLYAQWTINTYTVTFNVNGGTGTMTAQTGNYNTAAALTTNTFTRTGYTFAGWNTVAGGSGASYANGANYTFTANVTLYAQWTINTYTVTFNVNGGTGTMTAQTGNYNTAAALTTNTFTRTGYTFAGWNTVAGGSGASYANGANYTFTANVTLYAQWTINSYTVTFDANGGSGSMTPQTGNYNTTAALTSNTFTRAGYTFTGWNTVAVSGGTAYANGANYTFTASVTLYAQWAQNHTVTFNGNGSDGGSMSSQTNYTTTALTTNSYTLTGYTFTGWNTAFDGTGTPYAGGATYSFSADVTLYAQWSIYGTIVAKTATTATDTTTAFSINTPTVSTGDVVLLLISGSGNTSVTVPTAPSGWTALTTGVCSTPTPRCALAYYRVILNGATESGTAVTMTLPTGTSRWSATAVPFSGVNTTTPLDATPTTPFPSGGTTAGATMGAAAPAITTVTPNAMVAFLVTGKVTTAASITFNGQAVATSPTLTENVDYPAASSNAFVTVASGIKATVGSTGTGNLTASATVDRFYGLLVALRPTLTSGNTVVFNGNGSTGGSMSNQTANTATALKTNAFTRTDYAFAGWNTAANGSGTAYADGASYSFTADTTLYAQWAQNHTVTFNGNGSDGGSTAAQTNHTTTALTANGFTKTNYTFTGWNTAANGSGMGYANGATYSFAADLTLYAQWTVNTYTVTFDGNGYTGGAMSAQTASTTTALTTNAFTRTGYTFAGWNTVAGGGGTPYVNGANYSFAADITLYAQWTANTYTVTFDGNGGGSPSPASTSVTYGLTYGALATVSRTGYTFNGWFTATTGGTQVTTATTVTITANQTLYAQWSINSYNVSFNNNGGSSSMIDQTGNYNTTASLTLNTFTKTGYFYTGWNTAANGSGTAYADGANYTYTADVTMYAQWTAKTDPTASVINSPVVYNGASQAASVTCSAGAASNIKYNTSTTVPADAATYAVTADCAGDATHNAKSDVSAGGFVITKATPTLIITDPSVKVGGAATISASGGSGTFTYSTTTSTACLISGSTVTGLTAGAGNCAIKADQAESANYIAGSATQSFSVVKGDQTITFGPAPAVSVGATGFLTTTTTSGLAVTFGTTTPDYCTLSGANNATVTGVKAGACTVTATQAGNSNFNAAPAPTPLAVTIGKGNQKITFGPAPIIQVGGIGVVSATGGAYGNPVTFSTSSPDTTCTLSGATVTGVGVGTCSITANQAGTSDYNAAAPTIQDILITAPPLPANVTVVIQTTPPGLQFTVTDTGGTATYTAPYSFSWTRNSSHTIAAVSTQSGGVGVRYAFSTWSDGGTQSHAVSPGTNTTYTANFLTQYQLTTTTDGHGSAIPVQQWYYAGYSAGITVTPASGYIFSAWSLTSGAGPIANPSSASTSVTMNGPNTVNAAMIQLAPANLISSIDAAGKSGNIGGIRIWPIKIQNTGYLASAVQLDAVTLSTSGACKPTVTSDTAMPLVYGDIAGSASVTNNVRINFAKCPAMTKFTVTIRYSGAGITGANTYTGVTQ